MKHFVCHHISSQGQRRNIATLAFSKLADILSFAPLLKQTFLNDLFVDLFGFFSGGILQGLRQ
jgi:hypothetical protein